VSGWQSTSGSPSQPEAPGCRLKTRILLRNGLDEELKQADTAEQLGISDRMTRRSIREGELDRELDTPARYERRRLQLLRLDPFKALTD
jgi:hypothetical protein